MDGNLLTFLQHNRKIKYTLFLCSLRKKIYEPLVSLKAQVYKSHEPVPFSKVKTLEFSRIKPGDSWGGFFDCAWFRFNGVIDKNLVSDAVVLIDVGGEGCVYGEKGAVQGITNVLGMVDNFQSVKGKQLVPLNRIGDFTSGKIEFCADCGNNGKGGKSSGASRFVRADVCLVRKDILDLYYDVLACYQLLSAVKSSDKVREICKCINASISALQNTSLPCVQKARNELAPLFDGRYKEDFTVYAVGHGHLDLAWLWPVRETKRKAVRTFSNALYESEISPGYVFNGSQPQQYQWIKENEPALFDEIKRAVKEGRIEPQGGMWVEPDTNLPCGESLIRQCYYGKEFFSGEFGTDVTTLWLPDVFGYTAALPQIIKKCGMDSFMTIKLSWNNINSFPYHTFVWSGIDGSEVLVHMPPEGDYNSNATPYAFEKTFRQYKEKEVSNIALMSFGIGDGGAGPGEYHINMAERCKKLRYIPKVKTVPSRDFFDELRKNIDNYPRYSGELYLEKHQGTYTTQGKTKKNNRQCESLLHFAEWICTIAYLNGKSFPQSELDKIWKEVLLYQFHDILPGSSINRVYAECTERYEVLKSKLNLLIDDAMNYLNKGSSRLSAVNPTDFVQSGYVKHSGIWYKYHVEPYSSAELQEAQEPLSLYCSKDIIENEFLKVVFGNNGEIVELIDKSTGVNSVASAFNKVRIYKDRYVHPYNAWDIDINYTKRKPHEMKLEESREYFDGNTVVRENKYSFNQSTLKQKIILTEDSTYVKVENCADWHETHKMLRIDAYPKYFSDKVLCDIQFGNIERSTKTVSKIDYAQFEIPAHKWVDVYDGDYGVAILNDCKYGHRVKDGLISLNCLRSPVYPDPQADRGEHSFTYAIYPHSKKPMESELVKIGYALNNPIRIFHGFIDIKSFAHCSAENIIVETITVTEKGAIGVRIYETAGVKTQAQLKINHDFKQVYETDMLFKNPVPTDIASLNFGPFEVKTLEVII